MFFFYLQNCLLPAWQNAFLCHALGCSALETKTFPLVQIDLSLRLAVGKGGKCGGGRVFHSLFYCQIVYKPTNTDFAPAG